MPQQRAPQPQTGGYRPMPGGAPAPQPQTGGYRPMPIGIPRTPAPLPNIPGMQRPPTQPRPNPFLAPPPRQQRPMPQMPEGDPFVNKLVGIGGRAAAGATGVPGIGSAAQLASPFLGGREVDPNAVASNVARDAFMSAGFAAGGPAGAIIGSQAPAIVEGVVSGLDDLMGGSNGGVDLAQRQQTLTDWSRFNYNNANQGGVIGEGGKILNPGDEGFSTTPAYSIPKLWDMGLAGSTGDAPNKLVIQNPSAFDLSVVPDVRPTNPRDPRSYLSEKDWAARKKYNNWSNLPTVPEQWR